MAIFVQQHGEQIHAAVGRAARRGAPDGGVGGGQKLAVVQRRGVHEPAVARRVGAERDGLVGCFAHALARQHAKAQSAQGVSPQRAGLCPVGAARARPGRAGHRLGLDGLGVGRRARHRVGGACGASGGLGVFLGDGHRLGHRQVHLRAVLHVHHGIAHLQAFGRKHRQQIGVGVGPRRVAIDHGIA